MACNHQKKHGLRSAAAAVPSSGHRSLTEITLVAPNCAGVSTTCSAILIHTIPCCSHEARRQQLQILQATLLQS
jgi:hypothetical protein